MGLLKHKNLLSRQSLLIQQSLLLANGLLTPSGRANHSDYYQWLFKAAPTDIVEDGTHFAENYGTGGEALRANIVDTQVASFNGTNNEVDIPCTTALQNDSIFEFYIQCDKQGVFQYFGSAYETLDGNRVWQLRQQSDGKIGILIHTGTMSALYTSNAIVDDGNMHKINIYHSHNSGILVFYINNMLDNIADNPYVFNPAIVNVHYGALVNGASKLYWQGKLGQLKTETNITDIDIYAIIGQSNARGVPLDWGNLPIRLQSRNIHRFSYYLESGWQNINTTVRPFRSDIWGFEILFAEKMYAINNRRVCIIKVAKSGSNVSSDWQKGGAQYNEFIDTYQQTITALQAEGYNPNFKQLIEVNGENDSSTEQQATNFLTNHDQMISDMESDLSISIDNIVVAVIPDTMAAQYPYADNVRAAQKTIAARSGNATLDTNDFNRHDGIHYDSDALIAGGIALQKIVQPSETPSDVYVDNPLNEQDGNISISKIGEDGVYNGTLTNAWDNYANIEATALLNGFTLFQNQTTDKYLIAEYLDDGTPSKTVISGYDNILEYKTNTGLPAGINNGCINPDDAVLNSVFDHYPVLSVFKYPNKFTYEIAASVDLSGVDENDFALDLDAEKKIIKNIRCQPLVTAGIQTTDNKTLYTSDNRLIVPLKYPIQ